MDRTRRSLCGLGIASVPLAVIAPKLLAAAQEPGQAGDPLLAYLAADTKRHCRAASRPGEAQAPHVRALAANLGILATYVHSRLPVAEMEASFRARVAEEGSTAVSQRFREVWPVHLDRIGKDFGVQLPNQFDEAAVLRAIENLDRYGCPRLGGMRRWMETEADRLEHLEGRSAAAKLVRQTPGSDFGPPGWSAGVGDPGFSLTCWDLNVLVAAVGVLIVFEPMAGVAFAQAAVILNFVIAIVCSSF